jgi:thioredoxin 1
VSVQKVEFTDANFTAETNVGLSVVCFGDPRDAECRKEHALFEKAAEAITGQIKLGSCDIENCPALAERFQVTTIPTLLIIKDGREVERLTGFRREKALIKHLQKHVGYIF